MLRCAKGHVLKDVPFLKPVDLCPVVVLYDICGNWTCCAKLKEAKHAELGTVESRSG